VSEKLREISKVAIEKVNFLQIAKNNTDSTAALLLSFKVLQQLYEQGIQFSKI